MLKFWLVTSYTSSVHLWEESGSIFITAFHVILAGSMKIPPPLSLLKAEQNQFS